jgi:hypothetical protein
MQHVHGKRRSGELFALWEFLTGFGMIGEDVLRAYLFSLIHTEPWQKLDADFARKLRIYGEF